MLKLKVNASLIGAGIASIIPALLFLCHPTLLWAENSNQVDDVRAIIDMAKDNAATIDVNELKGLTTVNSNQDNNINIKRLDENAKNNAAMYKTDATKIISTANKNTERFKMTKSFAELKADINRVESNLYGALEQNANVQKRRADVLVFVSFSMPEHVIKDLMLEAEKYDASVNVRGLVAATFPKTIQKINKLVEENKGVGGINIDPEIFKAYKVDKVPAIVLKDNNNESFDIVYGLSGIKGALRLFADSGDNKDIASQMIGDV